jgi:zinc transport system ATP-binding protein
LAVSGLAFAVGEGEYLCVVGENGSGKSTLIKGLLRLLQPARGDILAGDGLRPANIGYLPQQTAAQKDFPASAFEVVLSGRLQKRGLRPFYAAGDKAAAEDNMRRLGIQSLRGNCYRELSGGQQRRVLLARALCAASRLLLLDEPVSGLDPIAAQSLYSAVADINGAGVAVVMVSHDVRQAMEHASHILHLGDGGQLFFGPKADYLKSEPAKALGVRP